MGGFGTEYGTVLAPPFPSFVSLNGESLKWCTDGTPYTEEYLSNFGISNASDNPPCYYLLDEYGASKATPTSVGVWLPNDFDVDAPGEVSVMGSTAYRFNQSGESEDVIVTPTAFISDLTPLTNTPAISKRPTFHGTAQPGATITVTVHSDPVTCTTTADADGNWSCTLPVDLEPGNHTVYVRITNPDNSVIELGPYAVIVNGPATTLTDTTPGVPSTGIGRATNAWIAGVYLAGAMGLSIGALAWCYVSYRRSR